MEEYHGVLVDASQKDKSIFKKLKILSQKKDGDWILYKVGVGPKEIEQTIKRLQSNMINNFYFHFYKDEELIIVFKKRIFRVKIDKSTWKEVIKYGVSLNIPEEQLDFFPCRTEDETCWGAILHKISRLINSTKSIFTRKDRKISLTSG